MPPADPRSSGGRPPRCLASCLLLVVAALSVAGCTSSSDPSPAEELAERLRSLPDVRRFEFDYAVAGSRVVDCFRPNQRYRGQVDYDRERLTIYGEEDAVTPVATRSLNEVLLHRALFADGTVDTPWIRVRLPVAEESRASLRTLLGAPLATTVLAEGLPPTAKETALSLLDVASEVSTLGIDTVDRQRATRYRMTVDPRRMDGAIGASETTASTAGGAEALTADVFVTSAGVVRIDIGLSTGRGSGGPAEDGWTTTYRDSPRPVAIGGGPVTDLRDLDPTALGPRQRGCDLPL